MEKHAFDLLKEKVFQLVDFHYDGEIEQRDCNCVFASLRNGRAQAGGLSVPQTARALFLFAQSVSQGKTEFEIRQQPAFSQLGAMVDCSRNGVMRVEKVKEFIDYMACLGMNMLMLYTEDTYELKEYPLFGYMRGRYSAEELKEIDDYAFGMGVELIPCIQTLGHMEQYLKWQAAAEVKDTKSVLLIDEPKTYELIECMIKTLRGIFRTKKIHIGMDEAWDIGLGNYLKLHGYTEHTVILNRHLNKVCDLCNKYEFHPMMWSDMFFRLTSKNGDYYVPDSEFSEDMINSIPDVDMVYWNYGGVDKTIHKNMIKKHKELNKNTFFAGASHTWFGFLPLSRETINWAETALKTCISAENIDTVFTTLWEDGGCDTNQFYALPLLTAYSEFCYRGIECSREEIASAAKFLTKIPSSLVAAMENATPTIEGKRMWARSVVLGNIFYRLSLSEEDCRQYMKIGKETAALYEAAEMKHDKNKNFYRYCRLLFTILQKKAELMLKVDEAYRNGDKAYLAKAADVLIPALSQLYKAMEELHSSEWMQTYKPFGYEVICARYGGQIMLNQNASRRIKAYLSGEIEKIEELEQTKQNTTPPFSGVNYLTASVIN